MSTIKNIHVSDYYKDLLEGQDLSIPKEKSWQLIKNRNASRLDNIAITEGKRNISYGEMFENWDTMARALSALGITRDNNSRALVIMPNLVGTCDIDYSLDMTGGECDFIDPTTSADKIEEYIKEENITDIIGLDLLYAQNLQGLAEKLKKEYGIRNIVLCHSKYMNGLMPTPIRLVGSAIHQANRFNKDVERMEDVIRNSRYQQISYDSLPSSALSLITHTSGTTTGIGKPIPLTDLNRNALVIQHDLAKLNFEPGMTMLHFIPYFAAYGSVNTAHLGLSKGMNLQEIPLFSPKNFGKLLKEYRPNIVLSIFSSWLSLIDDPEMQDVDLSFLEVAVSGGSPVNPEDEERINDFLKKHGCKVKLTKGYGLSELCGCGAYTIDGYNVIGQMGVVMPLGKLRIRDLATGEIIDPYRINVRGEALLHSPTLTSGVLDGKVVVPTMQIDGETYLPTKDIVDVAEEGGLTFVERKDRMFSRYDGYNLYPLHVENMLKELDEVADCIIVPTFNEEKKGNVPKIYIQSAIEIADKKEFIENVIATRFLTNDAGSSYKANFRDIPVEWAFVDSIPKNTMGKENLTALKQGIEGEEDYYAHIVEDNMSVESITVSKVDKKSPVKIKK